MMRSDRNGPGSESCPQIKEIERDEARRLILRSFIALQAGMTWRIEFERSAARELDKLDPEATRRILRFLRDRVAGLDDPRTLARPLKGATDETLWRYRVGDYRIIALVEDTEVRVLVVKIGPRREVYDR